jgi:hypothetical protein
MYLIPFHLHHFLILLKPIVDVNTIFLEPILENLANLRKSRMGVKSCFLGNVGYKIDDGLTQGVWQD